MLFKLALKNVKKSVKDYGIYFFTLVVAVAIFYIFNSLDAQESMFIMSESKYDIIKVLVKILGYISIFISVILGFLIVYSNNFLIKRRKKEFGLYLTLGMSREKVSFILVIETLFVGLISLGVGLVLGVFLSQFLSILTAKLFEVNMSDYTFVFSSQALIKSIIYFGIIFASVMVFNVISISRYKLIDLLNAKKKNEKIKIRNKYLIFIAFILSIGLLAYAYHQLFSGVLLDFNNKIIYMLIAGALGTFLLFFSVAGFFLKIFQLNKKVYFKNLNMFILKQVNNKINTTVISTTIICLMLLLTIGILSSSMSLANVYNSSVSNNNRTDFTLTEYTSNCEFIDDSSNCIIRQIVPELSNIVNRDYFKDSVKDHVNFNVYNSDEIIIRNLMDQKSIDSAYEKYGEIIILELNNDIDIIGENEYNQILNLYGEKNKKVDLKNDEYLLTANLDIATDFYKGFYENNGTLTLNGQTLKPVSEKITNISFVNFSGGSNLGTIIIDDSMVQNLEINRNTIIGNYVKTDSTEKLEKEFISNILNESFVIKTVTKIEMQNASVSLKAIFTFVGLYLGIVFAISSATILAIGQLSELSDNRERYRVLKELGADDKMIKRALIVQVAIAFSFPLLVAVIHSIFGLREINNIITVLGNIDLTANIFLTSLFIIIMYGGYFLATYFFSKNIIKNE